MIEHIHGLDDSLLDLRKICQRFLISKGLAADLGNNVLAKEFAFVRRRCGWDGDLFLHFALTSLYTHLPVYVSKSLGLEYGYDEAYRSKLGYEAQDRSKFKFQDVTKYLTNRDANLHTFSVFQDRRTMSNDFPS